MMMTITIVSLNREFYLSSFSFLWVKIEYYGKASRDMRMTSEAASRWLRMLGNLSWWHHSVHKGHEPHLFH